MARRLPHSVPMLAAAAALIVAAGLAGSAGGARTSAAADAPQGGTLRIGSHVDIDSVDPAQGYLRNAWLVADATCARLFSYRSVPGMSGTHISPEVVRSWAVSPDRRTYTFTLKRTFGFNTGAPVTAQSFADAFDRDAQPRFISPVKPYLREIVGATAVMAGDAKSISGIRVLGRDRLRIELTEPIGDFVARLTMPFFCPVPPNTAAVAQVMPAGSGAYYIAERIPNQRIVLRRNPNYGGDRPGNVDRIVWTIGTSLDACMRAVEEDRLDFCGEPGAPAAAYRGLEKKYGVNRPDGRLFVSPSVQTWFLVFNHTRPAFRGPGQIALKKAINFAIDRPSLVRPFGYLAGKRTDQLLPPAFTRSANIYPLGGADLVAARRWLARAQVKPQKLVLYTWNMPHAVSDAEILTFNLRQLGIDLDVKYFDPDAVYERMRTPGEPFDLVLYGWGADYPDAGGFLVPLLASDGAAGLIADTAGIRRRIEAANRLTGDARSAAWADLDVDVMRDNPLWVPFVHTQNRMFVSPSLGCFRHHPIVGVEITELCKKR